MTFSYDGTGGITTGGCVIPYKNNGLIIYWALNSTVYDRRAAIVGCIEAITIKRYHLLINRKTRGHFKVLYIDTHNMFWDGYELCSQEEAASLALTYWQNQQQYRLNAEINCEIVTKLSP